MATAMSTPPHLRRRETAAALGLLAALTVLFYAPLLFGGRTLLLRDLYTQFQGPRWWYRESLRAGVLPAWNPYIACGLPFLANPQNGVFYPLTLVFAVLPFGAALTAYVALHNLLLGFFSYLLARRLALGFWGALLAGIVAGFAGIPVKQVEFLEMLGGLAWTPLVLLAGWECLFRPRARAAALLGAALALQLLAGSPYPPLYSALGLAVLTGLALAARAAQRGLGFLVLGGGLGLLVGCAQYVPTLLLVRPLPASEMAQIMQARFSLRLRDLVDFLSPWLAGFPNWQKCFYVGVGALFLAGSALGPRAPAGAGETPALAGRRLWFCAGLIGVGWLFAQGHYLGIDQVMASLPLARRAAKWPTMALSLSILGLGLLAGSGLERWSAGPRRPWVWLLPLAVLALLGAVDGARGGAWLENLRTTISEPMVVFRSPTLVASGRLGSEAARLAAVATALALLLAGARRGANRRWLGPAVCLLVAAELYTAGRNLNFASPVDLYADPVSADVPQLLGPHYAEGSVRILVPKRFGNFGDIVYGGQIPEDFRILRGLYDLDTVMSSRVFTTQGSGSVQLPDYEYGLQPLLDALADEGSPAANRLLGAWNIGVVLKGAVDATGLHCEFAHNDAVLPRARLIEAVVNVDTTEGVLTTIKHGGWNPSTLIVAWDQHLADAPSGPNAPGAVERIGYDPAGVRVVAAAARPCYLVLAENWAEGWSARVDGVETPVYRVNFLQQAVRLTAGRHEVRFHYVAPGAGAGLLLAVLGLGGLAGCLVFPRRP